MTTRKDKDTLRKVRLSAAREPLIGDERPLPPSACETRGSVQLYSAELDRARSDYRLGKYDRAENAVNRFLERVNGRQAECLRGEAYTLLGRILDAREKAAEAWRAFQQAVQCFDEASLGPPGRAYSDYGRALYKVGGRDTAAREKLEEALASGYTHASTYRSLGFALHRLGHIEEAEKNLRKALELTPGNPKALRRLADCLEAQKMPEKAAETLRELAWRRVSEGDLGDALEAAEDAMELDPSPMSEAVVGSVLRLSGRDEEGAECLRNALEDEPGNAWFHLELGEALRDLGRPEEALVELNRANAIQPNDAFTLARLGDTLRQLERFEEALEALDKALEIKPHNAFTLVSKGKVLGILEQFDEALSLLDQGLEAQPGDPRILASKGEILWIMDREDEALEVLKRGLAMDPDCVAAMATMAEILFYRGEVEEALKLLERAAASAPEVAWIHTARGVRLDESGRLDEALETFDRALKIQPEDADALAHRGETLRKLGRFDAALGAFDRALKLQSKDDFALARRGETLRMLERLDEALECFDKALELEPDDDFTLARRGETLRMLERLDEALETLDRGLELQPSNSFMLASKGEILRVTGHEDEALEILERALAQEPDYGFALATQAQILRGRGDVRRALELLRLALEGGEADPAKAWMYTELGLALWQDGELDEALAAFERSIDLFPEDSTVHALQADLLQNMDRCEEALAALDEALEQEPANNVVLGVKGGVLMDDADYWEAYRVLDRVEDVEPGNAWILELKAFALYYLDPRLEPERLAKGEVACRVALRHQPEILSWHAQRADFLKLLGHEQEARAEYRWVVEHGSPEGREPAAENLSAVGWSRYRLGDFDAAVHDFAALAGRDANAIPEQFDLALILLCSGRPQLAEREYLRGLEMVGERHRRRRRGFLHVALADLEEAVTEVPGIEGFEEFDRAWRNLRTALDAVDVPRPSHTSQTVGV